MNKYFKETMTISGIILFYFCLFSYIYGCDSQVAVKIDSRPSEAVPVKQKEWGYQVLHVDFYHMTKEEKEKYLDELEGNGWKLVAFDPRLGDFVFHKEKQK